MGDDPLREKDLLFGYIEGILNTELTLVGEQLMAMQSLRGRVEYSHQLGGLCMNISKRFLYGLAILTASLFFLAGCSVASTLDDDEKPEISAKAAKVLKQYKRTGNTTSCINIRRINQIRALDERHFLVRIGVSDYYLNVTGNRCVGASRSSNRLQYTTSIAKLCRNEIITVVDNTTGILSGSCGLGDFERLEKKADVRDNEN